MMQFRRSSQRYGKTPQPETAYQRVGQAWDERIGSARVQAYSWRLMSLGELAVIAALSGGLVWQSMQSRVVPYVVAVDNLGEARTIARADAAYTPTDPQIAWFLSRFILDVRSVSLDPVLMRQNWLQAYDFVTERGGVQLSDYARAANPFAQAGEKSVSVQVTSVVRASPTSFQVKWVESAFVRGSLAGTTRWTGILTTRLRAPRTADILRRNPLGLYVDAVDWSRELDAPAPPASAAQAGATSPLNNSEEVQ
jgi:type IV secretion system protein VirB5